MKKTTLESHRMDKSRTICCRNILEFPLESTFDDSCEPSDQEAVVDLLRSELQKKRDESLAGIASRVMDKILKP